jgi:tripeptide aminopeptidase
MKKLLVDLLSVPTESGRCEAMIEFIVSYCTKKGMEVLQDKIGNLYVIKGRAESYPCVVAHMDTVHAIESGGIVPIEIDGLVTGFNPVTMEQTGIGGDDKCGIYAALRCLSRLPACKAVFFVDEEIGCVGSRECDLEFFKDTRFVLQADRRGHDDWVEDIGGPLGSPEFQSAVKPILAKYGYKPCRGMMTDVEALRDSKVGVSVANMSAGYYNPHEPCEYISLSALNRVAAMMTEICRSLTVAFPFTYERPPRSFTRSWRTRFSDLWKQGASGQPIDDWITGESSFPAEESSREQFPDYEGIVAEEYCMNCYDVFPASSMVQIRLHEYWCQGCLREFESLNINRKETR